MSSDFQIAAFGKAGNKEGEHIAAVS